MNERAIFGDFQTPPPLAAALVDFVARRFGSPSTVIEPTVGQGSILEAALDAFPVARGFGVDRDRAHLDDARHRLARFGDRAVLSEGDMFAFDYRSLVGDAVDPIAILGNPPWITSAAMPALGGTNLPVKSNRDRVRGIEAKTGRSNFDVSEWLVVELVRALAERDVVVGLLVKSQVARRVVRWAAASGAPVFDAAIVSIDSSRWFGASVDACAFVFRTRSADSRRDVDGFDSLDDARPSSTMGVRGGILVRDVSVEAETCLVSGHDNRAFRSGIKHDATDVFELLSVDDGLRNGLGERVSIESCARFPLVKGGDLGRASAKTRELVLLQDSLGVDPATNRTRAPDALAYLERHGARLDARKSSIYRGRPRFSVFGVGGYSFAPYKVAVFGLAKRARFVVLGPRDGRPTMVDDTAYFVPCDDEATAEALAATLESDTAKRLLASIVFADSKRPITMEVLRTIDLAALATLAHERYEVSSDARDRVRTLATSLVGTGH